MRTARMVLVAVLPGCLFSGEADPVTRAGVVANLLDDRLIDGAVVVVAPQDLDEDETDLVVGVGLHSTTLGRDGSGAALFTQWQPDGGALYFAARFDREGAQPLELVGVDPLAVFDARVGVSDGAVVVFTCTSGPGQVFVARPGDAALRAHPSPLADCPVAVREAGDGALLAVEETGSAFVVHRYRVGPSGLVTEGAPVPLDKGAAVQVWRVSDRGSGVEVLVGAGGVLTSLSGQGAQVATGVGTPIVLVPDGEDWLVALDTPEALFRWTPSTGSWSPEGRVSLDGLTYTSGGLDGALALQMEPWTQLESGVLVTGASWLAPSGGSYAVAAMPPTPCESAERCLEVGEWTPVGVVDVGTDRWGLWTVWSWLGPMAAVAAPF